MRQCLLRTVNLLHIGTLMHCQAAEPRSTAGLLFSSQCPSGMILLTPYSMMCDWRDSRAGPMLFYWPLLLYPYYSLLLFYFFFLSTGWYCGAGVFRTDRVYNLCITLSALHCRPLLIIIIKITNKKMRIKISLLSVVICVTIAVDDNYCLCEYNSSRYLLLCDYISR